MPEKKKAAKKDAKIRAAAVEDEDGEDKVDTEKKPKKQKTAAVQVEDETEEEKCEKRSKKDRKTAAEEEEMPAKKQQQQQQQRSDAKSRAAAAAEDEHEEEEIQMEEKPKKTAQKDAKARAGVEVEGEEDEVQTKETSKKRQTAAAAAAAAADGQNDVLMIKGNKKDANNPSSPAPTEADSEGYQPGDWKDGLSPESVKWVHGPQSSNPDNDDTQEYFQETQDQWQEPWGDSMWTEEDAADFYQLYEDRPEKREAQKKTQETRSSGGYGKEMRQLHLKDLKAANFYNPLGFERPKVKEPQSIEKTQLKLTSMPSVNFVHPFKDMDGKDAEEKNMPTTTEGHGYGKHQMDQGWFIFCTFSTVGTCNL